MLQTAGCSCPCLKRTFIPLFILERKKKRQHNYSFISASFLWRKTPTEFHHVLFLHFFLRFQPVTTKKEDRNWIKRKRFMLLYICILYNTCISVLQYISLSPCRTVACRLCRPVAYISSSPLSPFQSMCDHAGGRCSPIVPAAKWMGLWVAQRPKSATTDSQSASKKKEEEITSSESDKQCLPTNRFSLCFSICHAACTAGRPHQPGPAQPYTIDVFLLKWKIAESKR